LKIKSSYFRIGCVVISLFKNGGVKCQSSGFNLLVDPSFEGRVLESDSEEQKKLILRTDGKLPTTFPLDPGIIQTPGEYQVADIKILGIEIEGDSSKSLKNIFKVNAEDVSICFLGSLKSELKENILDKISGVDILFLNVGSDSLSPKQTVSLIKKIDPRIVVPLGEKVDAFAKELGEKIDSQEKLVIKAKDFEEENATKIIWLTTK